MEIDILGIDLAKRVFQLHGADRQGRTVYAAKVMRAAFLETVRESRPRIVAMEACGSAHQRARCFRAMGIEVRLVSPQYVTPFVKTNKNHRNDAQAIVEAASRQPPDDELRDREVSRATGPPNFWMLSATRWRCPMASAPTPSARSRPWGRASPTSA